MISDSGLLFGPPCRSICTDLPIHLFWHRIF